MQYRQPGGLGVLRGVIRGFSEEARTRGFASLTLVRFAFIRARISPEEGNRQFGKVRKSGLGLSPREENASVRFGSTAADSSSFSRVAALPGEAADDVTAVTRELRNLK